MPPIWTYPKFCCLLKSSGTIHQITKFRFAQTDSISTMTVSKMFVFVFEREKSSVEKSDDTE